MAPHGIVQVQGQRTVPGGNAYRGGAHRGVREHGEFGSASGGGRHGQRLFGHRPRQHRRRADAEPRQSSMMRIAPMLRLQNEA